MLYGICNLSIVPLRATTSDASEMISQVLFGETFEVLEREKEWSKIRLTFDNYEGFIDNKQYTKITEDFFSKLKNEKQYFSGEIIDFITNEKNELTTIPLGSNLPFYNNCKLQINTQTYLYEGSVLSEKKSKNEIAQTAFTYLNAPFLWGGKTPFGIDCSGFTQMVYKLCGYNLFRDAKEQATQGEVLSFIEESEAGDLAFFDNEEGEIIHVGIILKDYHIIHAHGKVRIDTLDHSGIFNADIQKHTHKLRIIKKMI
ncbi:C40 family peptidase [Polaribacter sp. Hel1_85]|uniref:C40 family peptidase n=1 Tax=Polaribacter sp. Hel1_85 TaxID=1250005 RepID=UPI00052E0409|nr:C40 family peptidase [Polaribacter sp. Hel1_85]KGL64066.1 NlpC/P60 family protein [Polaribacter sp. Hel1_85]